MGRKTLTWIWPNSRAGACSHRRHAGRLGHFAHSQPRRRGPRRPAGLALRRVVDSTRRSQGTCLPAAPPYALCRRRSPSFARVEPLPIDANTGALLAELIRQLHSSEAEALTLAVELPADLLLVDEVDARRMPAGVGCQRKDCSAFLSKRSAATCYPQSRRCSINSKRKLASGSARSCARTFCARSESTPGKLHGLRTRWPSRDVSHPVLAALGLDCARRVAAVQTQGSQNRSGKCSFAEGVRTRRGWTRRSRVKAATCRRTPKPLRGGRKGANRVANSKFSFRTRR